MTNFMWDFSFPKTGGRIEDHISLSLEIIIPCNAKIKRNIFQKCRKNSMHFYIKIETWRKDFILEIFIQTAFTRSDSMMFYKDTIVPS